MGLNQKATVWGRQTGSEAEHVLNCQLYEMGTIVVPTAQRERLRH